MDSDAHPLGAPARVEATPVRNTENPGLPISVQIVLNMRDVPLERPQSMAFAVLVDGNELASVPLHVLAPPPAVTS